MFLLSINYPSWLSPEIIPGFPLRWYGLMYVFAFATAFFVYRRQVKERKFPMTDDQMTSMFIWCIFGLVLGARLFSAFVYTGDFYLRQPWLIFWPFRNGQYVGLQGMSYHGGAIAGILSVFIYSKVKKYSFREVGDMFAAAIPLGFTFGRIGNFTNAELYGRATASPIGMIFPNAAQFRASEPWVQEMAEQAGIAITGAFVNLPRHPSQLYQAFFEGIMLWLIIWLFRNRKPFKGFLIGLYFLGYGFFRFFIEYFRQPDTHLGEDGFRIMLGANPLFHFTTGQILCLLMMVFGIVWLIIASRLPGREPIRVYTGEENTVKRDPAEEAKERNKRRKQRRKLK